MSRGLLLIYSNRIEEKRRESNLITRSFRFDSRLSVVSRGLHPIKGKGLMELFDVLLVGALDALLLGES
jgi:hypothetical protein